MAVGPIPDRLPIGTFHVLEDNINGLPVVGRVEVDGWTLFVSARKMSSEQARASGFGYVRPIIEGRRIVPEQ